MHFAALGLALTILTTIPTAITAKATDHTTEANHPPLVPITLQLRWLHQFQFAGYYTAKEKGFYRDEGFDVTIVAGGPGRIADKEVLAGRAQYAVGNHEIILNRLGGKPLVVLAPIFQHSPAVFLTRQDTGIRSPQDLVGRRIMTIGGKADITMISMLRSEGVDPGKVKFLKSSFDIDDLVEGNTDAFNSYLTNEPYFMKKIGVPVTVLNPATYGIDFYSDMLFTSEDEVENHPDRVKKFRKASLRGWKYAMQNKEEIIDLILSKYKSARARDHLRFEANAMAALILPDLIEIGHMNPGRLKFMADTFVKEGMADPDYSLDGFIYDPDPPPNLRKWYQLVAGLSIALLVVLLTVVTVVHFNRKQKREIVERKQAEEALKTSEARLQEILDIAPGAVITIGSDMNVQLFNKGAERIFYHSAEDVIGRPFDFLMPDRLRMRHYKHVEEFEQSLGSFCLMDQRGDVSGLRKDGTVFPATASVSKLEIGKERIFTVMLRDITELKQAEAKLVQSSKLATLGQIASGIAHELNQPLHIIRMASEMSLEWMEEGTLDAKIQKEKLEQIEGQAERMGAIINHMRTFVREDTGTDIAFSILGCIQNMLVLFEQQFAATGIDLEKSVPEDCGHIIGSPVQFEQVLMNLLTNARDAVTERAEAMASANRDFKGKISIEVTEDKDSDTITASVTDNGGGILDDVRASIFDPFYTTKEEGGGTGLGLSISFTIIESMGGSLDAYNVDGGTRFEIALPRAEGPAPTKKKRKKGKPLPDLAFQHGG